VSLAEDLARLRDLAAHGVDPKTNLALLGVISLVEDVVAAQDSLRMELVRHLAQEHERR
jgi:hypothetical protein